MQPVSLSGDRFVSMRTVIAGPRPAEVEALIERRKKLGQDRFDEIWKGDYHMNPSRYPFHGRIDVEVIRILGPWADRAGLLGLSNFNVGEADDFRVPDGGYLRSIPDNVWVPTAAIVVEILSPYDETLDKLPHYAAHGVEELLIVDPTTRAVRWFSLRDRGYNEVAASTLLGISATGLAGAIDWPTGPKLEP